MPRRSSSVTPFAFASVVAVALVLLFANVLRNPVYTPDGIVYARYAARDTGRSETDATLAARAFYERTPLMATPRYRALVELDPSVAFAKSAIFSNRVLYPLFVAALMPLAGFNALFIVSAIAYVFFGIVLFWLLSGIGRPWTAAFLTAIVLALPMTRTLAASDLTDMLSAVWWTGALAALLRAIRGSSTPLRAALGIFSVLLVLTRPTPYLIVLPALSAALLRGMWREFSAACAGAIAFVVLAVMTHAFGVREQLEWIYNSSSRRGSTSFGEWYRQALSSTLKFVIVQSVRTIVPVAAIVVAIYAGTRLRLRDEMLVLATAAVACLLAVFLNPVPSALWRVAGFPLLPVFCAALAAIDLALADRLTATRYSPVR